MPRTETEAAKHTLRPITEDTAVAYDRDGKDLPADRLQRWAYDQLAAAPELAEEGAAICDHLDGHDKAASKRQREWSLMMMREHAAKLRAVLAKAGL